MIPLQRVVVGVLVLGLAVSSQAQVPAIEAQFVKTSTSARALIVEQGRHLFSVDGRVRTDTFRDGEHTSRIVGPFEHTRLDRSGSTIGEWITVNHKSRTAVRGVGEYIIHAPTEDVVRSCSAAREELQQGTPRGGGPLGKCSRGPLVLAGFRSIGEFGAGSPEYVMEVWYFANTPIGSLAERRNVISDGHVSETRLTAVRETTVPENTFNVPAGYRVIDLPEWTRSGR